MILTYKYRIKDKSARKALSRHAYACNQVWNWAVAYQRFLEDRYKAGAPSRKWPSHFDLTRQCKGAGSELGIHQQTAQAVCRQFAQSRGQHRKCPAFRASFGRGRALGWIPFQSQSRQIDGNSVAYLGKRYRFWEGCRPLPADAKGGAFIEDSLGRWYVFFHVEVDALAPRGAKVGIDLGLKSLATLSNGRTIEAPRYYRQYEQRLAVVQRAGHKLHAKRIHAKIKNCRKDFLHKLSTELTRDHALIAVGNVNSKQLAKTRMAKSVFDAGWSSFRSMLKYKSSGYVEVDERFTTVTCSECGALSGPKGQKGLRVREWECSDCGASHDRDVNSARCILNLALGAQRLVGESRKPVIHG